MFLKNFTAYKLTRDLIVSDLNDLNSALHIHRERPLLSLEQAASGFTPPMPSYSPNFITIVGHCEPAWKEDAFGETFARGSFNLREFSQHEGDALVMMFYREEKIIVGPDVKRRLKAKIAEIEQREQRKVYKKEQAELRESIVAGILPHAQTRYWTVPIIFFSGGTVIVGAVGARAEHAISELRAITGAMPLKVFRPTVEVAKVLTQLAQSQQDGYPGRFLIASDFQMQNLDEIPSIARCKNTDISDEHITEFMADGRIITHAHLLWDSKLSFKVDPKLTIRSLKVDNGAYDHIDVEGDDDADSYVYTTSLIELSLTVKMLGELVELIGGLDNLIQVLDEEKNLPPIVLDDLAQYSRNTTPEYGNDDDAAE